GSWMPRPYVSGKRDLAEGRGRRHLPDAAGPPSPTNKSRGVRRTGAGKMLIRDSVAVVTGASRGIGRATALMLGAAGGKVVVNARTRSEALEQVAKTIGGERAEVAEGDVADFAACGRIARAATDRFG